MSAAVEDLAVRALRSRIFAFVRPRVPSAEDAEDIVQDVFARLQAQLAADTGVLHLDAWAYRAARNAIVDTYRRRGREEPTLPEAEADDDGAGGALTGCLRPFIDGLEAPYRDALAWTAFEGLSQSDAAARAGISVSGMKSRVQRGREELRRRLVRCCRVELDARQRVIDVAPGCACGPEALAT